MELKDRIIAARGNLKLTQVELAAKVGLSQQAIQKLESGQSRSSRMLTEIAIACGVRPEWLSREQGPMKASILSLVQPHETPPGYVRFQLLEGAAGMGDGVVNEDYPEVIRQVDMAEWEVRRKIGFLPPPGRIQILTGRGPSMRPRIDHGDVVMVDTSVDAFDGDGIYVINVGGETQIKMLQKRDDGMWIVSANPDYPAYRVAEGSAVHVGGRVLATLGVREL